MLPDGSVVKNLPANEGDVGVIPESGRSPGEEIGNPLQYSCLENLMDREGAWQATAHRVAKSQTQLRDFTFTFTFTFSSEPHSVRTLHHDPSILGGPTRHGL